MDGFTFAKGSTRNLRLQRNSFRAKSTHWEAWLKEFFPGKVKYDFSPQQRQIWEWVEAIKEGEESPLPLIAILARGAGKTTTLDLAVVYLLCMKAKHFALIVAANMAKSKARVKSIQSLLGNDKLRKAYPDVCEPAVNLRNTPIGWNERVLRTESGQFVVATSLDSDNRGFNEGVKDALAEQRRPDIIVFDDLDKRVDSALVTMKKEEEIRTSILPTAGDTPAATVYIQNLISPTGIAARVVNGETEWAQRRELIGPVPAIEGLKTRRDAEVVTLDDGSEIQTTRDVIVEGTAVWEGQSIAMCQDKIDDWGLQTFLYENQHIVTNLKGALWSNDIIPYLRQSLPISEYDRRVLGFDPAGGADVFGAVVAGCKDVPHPNGNEKHQQRIYHVLEDLSIEPDSDDDPYDRVIIVADNYDADIEAEINYGGSNIKQLLLGAAEKLLKAGRISKMPRIETVHAGISKSDRAEEVAKLYRDGVVFHARIMQKLEDEMTTWVPYLTSKSPNRIDAMVHAIRKMAARPKKTGGTWGKPAMRRGRRGV
jgi:hypothetical protein